MMKLPTVTGTALILGLLLVPLSGCDRGPAQRAGENVDDAVDRAGDSLERAGDRIQDAGRDARD
ncbi:hypothetical protein [Ectothiorhodospira lacustris]|uniref:hypothetical protein n=1 Tax=Ectothiorhodospira lacustris TaxID=2899127 RepID=UPI003D32320D